MANTQPTALEKADAADRWIEAEERLNAVLREMRLILAERSGPTSSTGPLFPFIGANILNLMDTAQDAIWKAHKIVAVQAYDQRREATKEAD